jgi:hypothetical protein
MAVTNAFAAERPLQFADDHAPLCISPCGRWVVTSDTEGLAFIRDVNTGQPVSESIRHALRIGLAEFNETGTRLVTMSLDRTARVWEVPTGRPVTPPLWHRYPVYRAIFSLDGSLLATGTREFALDGNGEARIWNAATGEPVTEMLLHNAPVYDLSFSPDARLLVTASAQMTTAPHGARLWEVATGRNVGDFSHEESSVGMVEFSPDGRWLATGGTDGLVRLWDVRSHQPLGSPLKHLRGISFIVFSPNGSLLATGSADGSARLWELPTGVPVTPRVQCIFPLLGGAFGPEGNALLISRHDEIRGESAVLTLDPDRRPFDALEDIVEMASGARINETAAMDSLATEEILEVYDRVRARSKVEFTTDRVSAERWHRVQARESQRAGDAFATRFHLEKLESLDMMSTNRPGAILSRHASWPEKGLPESARVRVTPGHIVRMLRPVQRAEMFAAGVENPQNSVPSLR